LRQNNTSDRREPTTCGIAELLRQRRTTTLSFRCLSLLLRITILAPVASDNPHSEEAKNEGENEGLGIAAQPLAPTVASSRSKGVDVDRGRS